MKIKKMYSIMFNPSKKVMLLFKIAQKLEKKKVKVLPRIIESYIIRNYGSYINLKANIDKTVKFMHLNGVIIGEGVTIEENVVIYHQVTLGGREMGDASKSNYPHVGKNVTIFAGAKILGNVKIGNNSIVGANSVVNKNVPENSTVAGVPAKIIKVR